MRTTLLFTLVLSFLFISPAPGFQADRDLHPSTTVVPDSQYRAGWLHELIFGSHWRDLWCTPIEVEELDLDTFAGGLHPKERGGGNQTSTLKFDGADGREYKFRSIIKNPVKVLPEELRESIAADFLQDQISSSNPVAPLIVAPLLDAAEILNARPRLVHLSRSEKLGEFLDEFGDKLGTIEENPDESEDESVSFAGADKVLGTLKLFNKLREDNDEFVDEAEYLKARLMDIFLGDWDRHYDQWRWAGYREDGRRRWVPIPRDRDQAFSRFDGLVPWAASVSIPEINGFGRDYPDIENLTWTGRFIDRRLLPRGDWHLWDSVSAFLCNRLTDSVINAAVGVLPAPMYELEGESLIDDLKSRRDQLPEAARIFYDQTIRYPEIYGSDKREYVEISYLPSGRVGVRMFKRDKKSGKKKRLLFDRSYSEDRTHEIRIFLLGGGDYVDITGERTGSIGVIVVGGEGSDELVDESTGGGIADLPVFSLFSTPHVAFYDSDSDSRITTESRLYFDDTPGVDPSGDSEKFPRPIRNYGDMWWFSPMIGANPDDGFFLGAGPVWFKYGYRCEPYVYRMQFRGGIATRPGKFRFDFDGDFYSVGRGRHVVIRAEYSQVDIVNYFGQGNTTDLNDALDRAGYYKAKSQHFALSPALFINLGDEAELRLGLGVKYFNPDPGEGTLLKTLQPSGSEKPSWFGGVQFEGRIDTRDIPRTASRGLFGMVRFSSHRPFTDGFHSFRKLAGEFRVYVTPWELPLTLSIGSRGVKNWGTFPWYESVFLGGTGRGIADENGLLNRDMLPLRGFQKQRFAGDAAAYGGAELRAKITSFMFLVPVNFGLMVSAETGRVFPGGGGSGAWHNATGGGIWFSFIDPVNVLSLSVVRSGESTGLYFATGYLF